MDFTIIIPTYNSEIYIKDCLLSIANIDYPRDRYEVIVVDGGSSDGTLDIINSFDDIKLVHSSNISISNSRNLAAAAATGDNFVFIDSDCLVHKDLLNKCFKYLKQYTCYGAFYSACEKHGWIAAAWIIVEKKPDGIVKWIPSGTLAVTRDAFMAIGGFNEALQVEEDEDFCHRIRANGGTIFNDSSIASVHLGQANSFRQFYNKEVWRGRSLIKPLRSYLTRKLSIFDGVIFFYFLLSIWLIYSLLTGQTLSAIISFTLLMIIPAALTLRIALRIRSSERMLQIFLLHIVFLFSRVWSIIKYKQFRQLFTANRQTTA